MNQEEFRKSNQHHWKQFKQLLDNLESRKKNNVVPHMDEFPHLYRKVCQQLDLARHRNYGSKLTEMLNDLVLRGHQFFYQSQAKKIGRFKKIFTQDFPRAVRKDIKLFWVASFLFYGPFFFIIFLIYFSPEMVYSVIDPGTVKQMEEMYDPAKAHERGFSDDITMFGFYVYNNTGIGLKTFGSSLILGIGSIFTLAFNGIFIGAVFGHLYVEGMGVKLFPFVIGHSSFELTAIVISGMAGLKLGLAFIIPKDRTRREAIKIAGRECMPLIYGFVMMFFVAAFIEGFWSPIKENIVSANIKYIVGACLWSLVVLYFIFVGREQRVR